MAAAVAVPEVLAAMLAVLVAVAEPGVMREVPAVAAVVASAALAVDAAPCPVGPVGEALAVAEADRCHQGTTR